MSQARRPNSLRLIGYDYSQCGAYHVTCTADGFGDTFGHPIGENLVLNAIGTMVEGVWRELPTYYPGVLVDVCKVMPDHFHGLLVLNNPLDFDRNAAPRTLSLPDVMQRFKSLTTHRNRLATGHTRLWRRGYWEEIITSQQQYENVQRYIDENAVRDYLKRNGF
jgi:putative transposase